MFGLGEWSVWRGLSTWEYIYIDIYVRVEHIYIDINVRGVYLYWYICTCYRLEDSWLGCGLFFCAGMCKSVFIQKRSNTSPLSWNSGEYRCFTVSMQRKPPSSILKQAPRAFMRVQGIHTHPPHTLEGKVFIETLKLIVGIPRMFLCNISAWFLWRVSVTIENGCCSIVALWTAGERVLTKEIQQEHTNTHAHTHRSKCLSTNTHTCTHTHAGARVKALAVPAQMRETTQFWHVIACSVLQHVEVCSVLQYFAVCRYERQHNNAVLARHRRQCVAARWSVQRVAVLCSMQIRETTQQRSFGRSSPAVCCSALMCVAVCCSILQYADTRENTTTQFWQVIACSVRQRVELCCSVLQCADTGEDTTTEFWRVISCVL